MKLKDVGFFQQHVEKLILGGGILFLLLVGLLSLNAYTVEVNGSERSPAELEALIVDTAESLQARLASPETNIPEHPMPPHAELFKKRLADPLMETPTLPPLGQAGLAMNVVNPPEVHRDHYHLPRPPVATGLVARATYGVLGLMEDRQIEQQILQIIGDHQPRDFRYVVVGAKFDMGEWIKRLQADPAGEGQVRLPDAWWQRSLALAGVYLQREELDPATGQWGNQQIVKPLPIQVALIGGETREWAPTEAEQTLQFIQANQEKVARHDFLPLADTSRVWLPPDADSQLTADQQRELRRLFRDIHSLEQRIEQTQTQLDRELQRLERERQRPGAPQRVQPRQPMLDPLMDDPAMAGDPGMGGNPGPAAGRRQPNQPRPQALSRQEELTQRLQADQKSLQEKLQQRNEMLGIDRDLASLGGFNNPGGFGPEMMDPAMMDPAMMDPAMLDPAMMPPPFPGQGRFTPRRNPYAQQPGQSRQPANPNAEPADQTIQVWAHDLDVEPGKTYRYRVIVSVLNPLFQKDRVAVDQREENFDKIALAPSEEDLEFAAWSDPVTVDPEYYFFLVGGSAQQRQAEVEVWRVYGGQWRVAQFDVQPGDPIGGTTTIQTPTGPQTLDMWVDSVVVDLLEAAPTGSAALSRDTRMLYLESETGQIADRTTDADRNDTNRVRLQNEADLVEAMAQLPPLQ